MPRRKTPEKRIIEPDSIYNSTLISMIVNRILWKGKKNLAQSILYEAMKNINSSTSKQPLEIIEKAIQNATPIIEIKAKRVGGSTYQVPVEIKKERGKSLAIKFLIKAARKRTGKNIIIKLQNEILDAYNNTGNAVKKKEEIHKSAEANKAFSTLKF